jgi:glycosyltransferase involved in cell wall biosynthesis
MKIAITGPHFWPYRRRGSAAYIFNLSNYLVRQGHKVEIITSKPGKPKIVNKGNMTITYLRYIQHPVLDGYNINRVHLFTLNCFVHLLRRNYDIVHCIYHPDGFSAYLQKMFKRLRYVLLVTTTPFTFHWKHSPIDPYMFKKAVTGAKRCVVPSCYARDCMKRDHDVDCELIPCGVDLQHFHVNTPKDLSTPRILCTAALHDERKRVPVLIKAFEFLVQGGTKAILQLAGETDDFFLWWTVT